jgi:hypothetical protein
MKPPSNPLELAIAGGPLHLYRMMNQFTTVLCPVTAVAKRRWVVLLLMSAAACGGNDPASVTPAPTVPGPVAPVRYTVSGTVMERTPQGARPAEGAHISLWFQESKSRGFRIDGTTTDAGGRYRLVDVPKGFLVPFAQKSGYDQPCSAATSISSDATVDMELVPSESPLPPTTGASPTLSGVVFETTPEGARVAIPGVRINWGGDLNVATTHSDAAGRYAFCHLPTTDELPGLFSEILAFKEGYAGFDLLVPLYGSMAMDLEMKKR